MVALGAQIQLPGRSSPQGGCSVPHSHSLPAGAMALLAPSLPMLPLLLPLHAVIRCASDHRTSRMAGTMAATVSMRHVHGRGWPLPLAPFGPVVCDSDVPAACRRHLSVAAG